MNESRALSIKIGKNMGWEIPINVKFSCDGCVHVGKCHHAFDPCNMIIKSEIKCLSEGIGTEWKRKISC